ncbi:macrolide ABC transporter ATP-binding protein [Gammaproteobacteria bacterium 53_120_T64]|nr:macrolide ABC transporter ATP-binding protein [Gammaproteobacteria bacterium 53_120_T64]
MIELQQLCRSFQIGDQCVHALDHIDLKIESGAYLSVMGPSGSGKSTLLNMLGLLDTPSSGEYLLNQTATSPLSEEPRATLRREHIGFVFQSYHLIPRLTARENIELPLILAGMPPKQRRPLLDKVMTRLALSDRAAHAPKQLSGGQRQRVAIGRAIVMKPQLLLADEPTGNLDSTSGREVIELLEELNDEGITLLVVTHDQNIGERARRELKMIDGRIASDSAGNAVATRTDV